MGKSPPLGDYRIEFDGKNGHWMESLQIYVENGKLAQSIKVTGFGGKHLFEEHNSAGKADAGPAPWRHER